MQKSKTKTLNNSIINNTLKGMMAGIVSFTVFLAIFSLVILKTDIESRLFFIFILITVGLSAFIGSFFTSAAAKKTRLLNGLLTTLILLVLEFILLLCFNNASLSVKVYLMIPIGILLGFIGGALGSNLRKK